jgi:hypothetical protein
MERMFGISYMNITLTDSDEGNQETTQIAAQSVWRRAVSWTARAQFPAGAKVFCLQLPDRLCGTLSLLSNGSLGLYPWG